MKYPIRAVCAVLSALVLVTATFAAPVSPEQKKQIVERMVKTINDRAYAAGVEFDKLEDYFEKHQGAIDKASEDRTFAAEVNKTLREFGISHIRLLTPVTAANRVRTSQVGIGVTTRKMDDGLAIAEVVGGSPAESAGVREGDIIIKIDGLDAATTEPLSGDEGSKVTLTVRRADGRTVDELTVVRGKFSTRKPETLTLIDDDAAILRVATFSTGYDQKNLAKLFERLAQADRKYLVVDLRGNGGGAVTNLNHLLSFFLPKGTAIGTNVSRTIARKYKEEGKGEATDAVAIAKSVGANQFVRAEQPNRFNGKVVVLIDRGSASASEIFSAALREQIGTPLVGQASAGAVLVSVHSRLVDGWEVQIPISDYVTTKGIRLEGHKLKPDLEVKGARKVDPSTDDCVQQALRLLRKPSLSPSSEPEPAMANN